MFKLRWLTLIIIFGVCSFNTPAKSKKIEHKKSYASFDIGAVQQESQSTSVTAIGFGVTVTGTVTANYEPGIAANFAIGHHFNDYLALEADFGYAYWEYDDLDITGTATSGGTSVTFATSAALDGSTQIFSIMPNLILYPLGKSDFSPYIGIGAGSVYWWEELNSIGTLAVNAEESGVDVAVNALLGFNFRVGPASTLGVKYKYGWMNAREVDDDPILHSLTASFKQRF